MVQVCKSLLLEHTPRRRGLVRYACGGAYLMGVSEGGFDGGLLFCFRCFLWDLQLLCMTGSLCYRIFSFLG